MNPLSFQYLQACAAAVAEQQNLLSQLAFERDALPEELYYQLVSQERSDWFGEFAGGEWEYYFHGGECDLSHQTDGRFLLVSFGVGGRTDAFRSESILQFIVYGRPPWPVYPGLRSHLLADAPKPLEPAPCWHLPALGKAAELQQALVTGGLVEPNAGDPARFRDRLRLPQNPNNPDVISEEALRAGLDRVWANRYVIAAAGHKVLQELHTVQSP